MTDYSKKKINFENVDLEKLLILINVLKDTKTTHVDRLKKRFEEHLINFEDVFQVLLQTSIVKVESNQLLYPDSLFSLTNEKLANTILKKMFSPPIIEHWELDKFVNLLHLEESGSYRFSPSRKVRLETSGMRNFLISLGFLHYNADNDFYVVSQRGLDLLSVAQGRYLSSTQFKEKLERLEKLGEAAEQEVLEYEKNRLKQFKDIVKRIKQVSKEKVNAGYDILSFSHIARTKTFEPRYIEVKAVSNIDRKFFWTRNEMAKAKSLKDSYHLYLVPVKEDGFDLDNLAIIKDPYTEIYLNKTGWQQEIELVSFVEDL